MIRLQSVTKNYETAAGAYTALHGISLTIEKAGFVTVTGKSGSGKSTLLNMLGGIDRPSSGTIRIGDTVISELNEERLAAWRGQSVGFVFQFFQLLPTLTAAENVMLPMDFRRAIPLGQRRPRALDLLAQAGVADQADKLPSSLSGGQQQRVAIARALANDPPIILADEPTGNLDSHTSAAIFRIFRELADNGRTVIVVTHDRESRALADRQIALEDGVITSELLGAACS